MNASDYRPLGKIEQLPPATKAAVIDAILAGRSLRDVGKIAGCSPMVVSKYRDDVVLPTVTGQSRRQGTGQGRQVDNDKTLAPKISCGNDLEPRQQSTKDVMRASPVKERLQKLYSRTDRMLDRVEADEKLLPLASGLLNQAHKNVEIHAKMTGELGDSVKGPAFAIQIVMPGIGAAPAVTVDMSEGATIIDVGANIGNGPKD